MCLGSTQSPNGSEPGALFLGERQPKQKTLTSIYMLRRCGVMLAPILCFRGMLCSVGKGQLYFLLLVWLTGGLDSRKSVLPAFTVISQDISW